MKKSILPLIILLVVAAAFLGARLIGPIGSNTGEFEGDALSIAPAQAAAFYNQENRLVAERGSVDITKADGTFVTVSTETTVGIGDAIAVSDDGLAVLYWFDDSVSRLSGGTEMRIAMADYDPEHISATRVDFEVVKGNVWSKVINLIDGNASFTARSGDVAAGVRGSVFNIAVSEGEIVVDAMQHAVNVRQSAADGTMLGEAMVVAGRQAVIPTGEAFARKFSALIENQPSEKLKQDWYVGNAVQDARDAAMIKARNMERLEKRVGRLGDVEAALALAEGEDRASLAVAKAKLAIGALVLSMDREGADGKDVALIAREIAEAEAIMEAAGIDAATQASLLADLAAELTLVDRMLSDVLPDNEGFYRAKDGLREMTLAHLPADARAAYEERMAFARLFELHDSLLKGWTLACEQDALINGFKERASASEPFKRALARFLEDVLGMCGKTIELGASRIEVRFAAPLIREGLTR